MKAKIKFNLSMVIIILFLMLNIILINNYHKDNILIVKVNNHTYLDGCMNMLAIEYNYSYPILNRTLEPLMEEKYMRCIELK